MTSIKLGGIEYPVILSGYEDEFWVLNAIAKTEEEAKKELIGFKDDDLDYTEPVLAYMRPASEEEMDGAGEDDLWLPDDGTHPKAQAYWYIEPIVED